MQLQAHTAQTQQQMQAQQQTLTLAQQQLQAQAGRADQQLRELQRDNQRLQAELARQQPAQGQEVIVIVIVVSRDRRECFRRFESDEQRSEVMAEYTEVDSLYVCM